MQMARLLAALARETDAERALDRIATAARETTRSRQGFLAVLNEQLGCLEVRHGSPDGALGRRLPIDVGESDGIVGLVAATGDAFLSGNVPEDPRYKRLFPDTVSELAEPVKDRHGRVRAVLNVESERRDAYTDEDRETLRALSHLVSLVLDQNEHRQREEALIQVARSLDAVMTEEALVVRVIGVAREVLDFQACSIFLHDAKSDRFVLRGTIGILRDQVDQISYERGEGFTGWVCDVGRPILLDDPQTDPRWRGKYVEVPSEQIASFLAVPIVGRGQTLGAIRCLRRKADNPFLDNRFTSDDLRLLEAIAEQVAVGLGNVRNMQGAIRSERMIAWGELSAKSSHMIGNRVFALKGDVNELGHLLQEGALDVATLKELQQSLCVNVTRVEEILQDFRDFVTATGIQRSPTDLAALVRETAQEVFPRRGEVALDLDLAPLPLLQLDGKRLRRAVSELIENALNYMEAGRLRIALAEVERDAHDRTRRSKVERWAELVVEDSGPGVEAEKKGLIFQPFFSGRVKGMGLGLSIVKGIVDAHGGEVFESGEPGAGARFVMLFPIE